MASDLPPMSPSRQQAYEVDKIDLTPRNSASYLVSNTHITLSHHIIPPVFEHVQVLSEPNWALLKLPGPSTTSQQRPELKEQLTELKTSLGHAQQHIKAQNAIIEGNHAQMIIQDLHLHKLNQALQGKEKKEG
ncbi:hypothetical protein P691DRAFT_768896 [Macrolepiota fuliginosa MF-IS2]|uniref:Uncharacterized protein n=1 Tax=Macrolepiota fuliginosa MF-IS2 TaxID=1400762 RepID=A0A9P6BVH6_9AGAR|nr:hypothetical protein P691DRAFT_768896 [Macrolepiota fuliginosa MF-IS2]